MEKFESDQALREVLPSLRLPSPGGIPRGYQHHGGEEEARHGHQDERQTPSERRATPHESRHDLLLRPQPSEEERTVNVQHLVD